MRRASLIATLSELPSPAGAELSAFPASIEWLEVRADLLGDLDPEWLRSHFAARLLYTLRTYDAPDRLQRLKAAAPLYDRIELEASRDLSEELLQQVPPEKRLISWYGRVNDLSELDDQFKQLSKTPASLYKLVNTASTISEEFLPLF